jgi:hypothetical protein
MPNDDDNDPTDSDGVAGFAIQMPGGLGEFLHRHARDHDRHHMEIESLEMRIHNFLDGLDVEQLLVLRRILNADRDSAPNNYFDGQIVAILRVVHHVNAEGKTQAELLAEAEAEVKGS